MKTMIAVLLIPMLLVSCTQKGAYRDDLTVEELSDEILKQIPVEYGYQEVGETHVSYYFDGDDLPEKRRILQSVLSENINEIGVFYTATEEEREELREELEEYLEEMREEKSTFVASYAPAEVPKLTAARVRSFGSYTVYAILSPDDQARVWETTEELLRLR